MVSVFKLYIFVFFHHVAIYFALSLYFCSFFPCIETRDSGRANPMHNASVNVCQESHHYLTYTEHVVAHIKYIYHGQAVEFKLCSPTNTCSQLLTVQNTRQLIPPKRVTRKWRYMSLQFWGEDPNGTWVLNMSQNSTGITLKGNEVLRC